MLRRILLAGLASAMYYGANAQTPLTLTKDNVPFVKRDVNVKVVNTTNFSNPTMGDNQTWDYGKLGTLGDDALYYYNSGNNQFSGTALYETVSEPITQDRYIDLNVYRDITDNGLVIPGFSTDYQVYGIGDMTGNPKDSFYVLEQTQLYGQPLYSLQFPVTKNSVWNSQASRKINYQLTVTNFGLNKTPGSKVSNFTQNDSVAGWGRMRLPVDTLNSMWYDVLMVNRTLTVMDSIYLNGTPAPAMMMAAFGLQQGAVTTEYRTYFYRANDFFPLMVINYGDDATFKTPISAMYTTDNVIVTGIKEKEIAMQLSLYPNPVNGNNFQVGLFKNDNAEWKLNIVNALGQNVLSSIIDAPAGQLKTKINLENTLNNGVYFVQVIDGNGLMRSSSKIVLSR